MLRRSFPYAQIITLGSAKDAEIAAEIVAGAPFVRNLCGQTSLDDAVDLLALSEAAVCNDSGLMHVTAALNRPQVAVFGSSDPRHTPRCHRLRVSCGCNSSAAPASNASARWATCAA